MSKQPISQIASDTKHESLIISGPTFVHRKTQEQQWVHLRSRMMSAEGAGSSEEELKQ